MCSCFKLDVWSFAGGREHKLDARTWLFVGYGQHSTFVLELLSRADVSSKFNRITVPQKDQSIRSASIHFASMRRDLISVSLMTPVDMLHNIGAFTIHFLLI